MMSRQRFRKVSTMRFATWEEALEDFLLEKKAAGRAERTLKDYEFHVKRFFKHHPDVWGDEKKLRHALVEYFGTLARENTVAFYNICLRNLRGFFEWLAEQEVIRENPVTFKQRKDEGLPRAPREEDVAKLIKYLEKHQDSYAKIRDLALVLFSLDTGIRPSEALQLKPENIDLKACEAFIPAEVAKTRRGRMIVFSARTAKQLNKLLSIRPKEWGEDAPLFANEYGQYLAPSTWIDRLGEYSAKLGIKITPYSLRHASATFALRNGATPFFIQRQLGHMNLDMTKRYTQLTSADLHKQIEEFSPVERLTNRGIRIRKTK